MILPTEIDNAVKVSPRRMFIFSQPKTGKTSVAANLPNSLLIDAEDGSEFVKARKINIHKIAKQESKHPLKVLKEVSDALAKKEVVYDYIIIDTATALENLAWELALIRYKESPIGKNFTGKDVSTLANGAGYSWLRNAFDEIYSMFDKHATKCLVLLGHAKTASILKDGKELNAKDINLTGKLKFAVTSNMDAIGYLYRDKESNSNILSFKTEEQDLATGARPEHLRDKSFVISEFKEGDLITYWDKIFID
jgi:hypothetical protein